MVIPQLVANDGRRQAKSTRLSNVVLELYIIMDAGVWRGEAGNEGGQVLQIKVRSGNERRRER